MYSSQANCVAVVVPDEEQLMKAASSKGWEGDFTEICKLQVKGWNCCMKQMITGSAFLEGSF